MSLTLDTCVKVFGVLMVLYFAAIFYAIAGIK